MHLMLRKMVLIVMACLVGFLTGLLPACNYSKSYFRIGPDGKMIKADGPIVPGEDTAGGTTGGSATTGGGTSTGDSDTSGAGTGGSTSGGTTGGISGIPVYPLIIQTKDESDIQNLYLAHYSQGTLDAPKPITAETDSSYSILFPALSPDASSVIYSAFWYDDATKKTKGEFRMISNLSGTPSEAAWNAADPGVSPSWRANGQDILYVGGGCGLLRKAKASDPSGAATEVPQPTGDYDKWVYFQTSVAPTADTSNPTFDLLLFSMFSADSAPKQGFDLFARKIGDADPSHISRLTNTPTKVEFYPSISPDGKYILFANMETTSPDPSSSSGPSKLAVCDLASTSGSFQCSNLRTLDAMAADAVSSSPCWSWDGTKVFFVSKDSTHKLSDVYVVDFSGGNFSGTPVNLTNTEKADDLEISCASAPVTK